MPARSADDWFALYGQSHRDPRNKAIHWVCVPVIAWTVVALLWSLPPATAAQLPGVGWPVNWAVVVGGLVLAWYLWRLGVALALGMALFLAACLALCAQVEAHAPWPLWGVALAAFAAAWVGQFHGHHLEGARPSFLQDLQFLLVGPAWLLGFVYRRLHIPY